MPILGEKPWYLKVGFSNKELFGIHIVVSLIYLIALLILSLGITYLVKKRKQTKQ
jgi:CHASE1-domain containing sensor protein